MKDINNREINTGDHVRILSDTFHDGVIMKPVRREVERQLPDSYEVVRTLDGEMCIIEDPTDGAEFTFDFSESRIVQIINKPS